MYPYGETARLIFKVVVYFTLPRVNYESSHHSTFSSIFGVISLNFSHSVEAVMVFHWGFTLISLMASAQEFFFMCLLATYIPFFVKYLFKSFFLLGCWSFYYRLIGIVYILSYLYIANIYYQSLACLLILLMNLMMNRDFKI